MIDEAGVSLRSVGIRDDLRPENRQYLKCAKEHADGTFSPTQLDPAEHTCLVHLFMLLCALVKKNTSKNFAPRESRLALIVGSRSWWQMKAASFLLAPRPFECLVTGNLATKSCVFDSYSPPVVCAGRVPNEHVHVAIDGPGHGRHFVLTSLCDPYFCVHAQ